MFSLIPPQPSLELRRNEAEAVSRAKGHQFANDWQGHAGYVLKKCTVKNCRAAIRVSIFEKVSPQGSALEHQCPHAPR